MSDIAEKKDTVPTAESRATRVLLVDDSPTEALLIREIVTDTVPGSFSIEHVERLDVALLRLRDDPADVVLLDLNLPDSHGLDCVETVRSQAPEMPIVVLTKVDDDSIGVAALKSGAQDYLSKNQANGELLVRTLRYAIERQRVRTELQEVRLAQLRQQERLNRELAARNKDLEEFAYVASHDLREPLRKMISFSDLLKRDLGEPVSDKVARDLQFIRNAAARMQKLVEDLLALSRAGGSTRQRQRLALDDCVDAALEALQIKIQESGAAVEREALPKVWGDATILTQLFQNLISNAIKF